MAILPSWTNVAIPSFADSSDLLKASSEQYNKVGTGLKETAQEYQDQLRKRNHGVLQEFINSATSPEELQSEAFNQKFKDLQAGMQNEYDSVAVGGFKDARGDVLTKRASDVLNYDKTSFGFDQDKLKAATIETMQRFTGATTPEEAEAIKIDGLNRGTFNPDIAMAYDVSKQNLINSKQDYQAKEQDINFNAKTEAARIEALRLANLNLKQTNSNLGIDGKTKQNELDIKNAEKTAFLLANPIAAEGSSNYRNNLNKFGLNAKDQANSPLAQEIFTKAAKNGVNGEMLYLIANIESGLDPSKPNKEGSGASGLFQHMPAYFKERGITDPFDSTQNIDGAIVYAKELQKKYGDDDEKTAAAWNYGQGALDKVIAAYGDDWKAHLPKETKDYLERYNDTKLYMYTDNDGTTLNYPQGGGSSGRGKGTNSSGGSTNEKLLLERLDAVGKVNTNVGVSRLTAANKGGSTYAAAIATASDRTFGGSDIKIVREIIEKNPAFNKLSDPQKADIFTKAVQSAEGITGAGSILWTSDAVKNSLNDNVNQSIKALDNGDARVINLQVAEENKKSIRKSMVENGGSAYEAAVRLQIDPLAMFYAGVPSPLENKGKLAYEKSDKSKSLDVYLEAYIEASVNGTPLPANAKPDPPSSEEKPQETKPAPNQEKTAPATPDATGATTSALTPSKPITAQPIPNQSSAARQLEAYANDLKTKQRSPVVQKALEAKVRSLQDVVAAEEAGLPVPESTPIPTITAPNIQTQGNSIAASKQRQELIATEKAALSKTTLPLTKAKIESRIQQLEQEEFNASNIRSIQEEANKPLTAREQETQKKIKQLRAEYEAEPTVNTLPISDKAGKVGTVPTAFDQALSNLQNTEKAVSGETATPVTITSGATKLADVAKVANPTNVATPFVKVEEQKAPTTKATVLSVTPSTGEAKASSKPFVMPSNIRWGKPIAAVQQNPISAKLPQQRIVAQYATDGDGIRGKLADGTAIDCRVMYIDAPETEHLKYNPKAIGQPYGNEAKKVLADLIKNKEVSIRVVKSSNEGLYDRSYCEIEVEGADISLEMIERGAAYVYDEYVTDAQSHYKAAEGRAKAAKLGIFSDAFKNSESPAEYRRRIKPYAIKG